MLAMSVFAEDAAAKKVELKDVPKEVLDAAKEKVKGLEAKEVTVTEGKESKAYDVKGTAEDKAVEVDVTVGKDGKVTKAEVAAPAAK